MDGAPELDATLEAALEGVGELGQTIEQHPRRTITPDPEPGGAARLLQMIGTFDEGLAAKLELHETLGEGGMGVVRLGTQRSLARKVAVKTLKAEHRGEHQVVKLLREAWVTGTLEHPNVVPVYDVATDGDGAPQIVLKRIEGTSWDALMHDPRAVRDRFGSTDLLDHNLRILMQVCNAVHFAHARGILHRDLKPDNVMIGAFGEVYVVDWGIAVALRDDGGGRVPLASEAIELAGTPAYMAPEMLGGKKSRLSERSDIYLLGSILYEVVTGQPPHQGETLMEMVHSIIDSSPPLSGDVPGPLRRIIRRCMDPDPAGRFETAEQVRLALQGYLRHRDAIALAVKADERRAELDALLAEEEPAREAVYHAFAECRFGYRHALEVYAGHAAARGALREVTEQMVRFELAQSEPDAAHALLAELSEPPEALTVEIERARDAKRAEEARARRLRDEHDPQAGRRTRAFVAGIIGLIWSAAPLLLYGLQLGGITERPTHLHGVIADATFLVLIGGLFIWARESMTRTLINRRMMLATLLAILSQLALQIVGWVVGEDVNVTFRHEFMIWAMLLVMLAQGVDWRLTVPAAIYAAGFVFLSFVPEPVMLVMGLCNFSLFVSMVTLWGRLEDLDPFRERVSERRERRRAWLRRVLGRGGAEP